MERLAAFLSSEASVEAILVDPSTHAVSLATLGQVDTDQLQSKLAAVLRSLDEAHITAVPATAGAVRTKSGVTVKLLPHEALLEKPSCQSAPLFWKWRQFEWPAPEEIEEESGEEWKALTLQATICGDVGFVEGA